MWILPSSEINWGDLCQRLIKSFRLNASGEIGNSSRTPVRFPYFPTGHVGKASKMSRPRRALKIDLIVKLFGRHPWMTQISFYVSRTAPESIASVKCFRKYLTISYVHVRNNCNIFNVRKQYNEKPTQFSDNKNSQEPRKKKTFLRETFWWCRQKKCGNLFWGLLFAHLLSFNCLKS